MIRTWHGAKWIRRSTRDAIYHRDGFACVYCTRAGVRLTLDHLLAVDLGGTHDPANLVTACLSCNSAKQGLSVRAWFRRLRARGADTTKIGRRVRRLTRKALDRAEGRRLARARTIQL